MKVALVGQVCLYLDRCCIQCRNVNLGFGRFNETSCALYLWA